MKKNLIRDENGTIDSAKIAFWITLLSCLGKMFVQENPDYAGLALFLAPVATLYFGRSHTKATKEGK